MFKMSKFYLYHCDTILRIAIKKFEAQSEIESILKHNLAIISIEKIFSLVLIALKY